MWANLLRWLSDQNLSAADAVLGALFAWLLRQSRHTTRMVPWFDPDSDLSQATRGTIPERVARLEGNCPHDHPEAD